MSQTPSPADRPQVVAATAPAPALVLPPLSTPPLSITAVLPWLVFAALLLLVGLYFVSTEQGALSVFSGTGVHEWVHDGRHLLGFPCH